MQSEIWIQCSKSKSNVYPRGGGGLIGLLRTAEPEQLLHKQLIAWRLPDSCPYQLAPWHFILSRIASGHAAVSRLSCRQSLSDICQADKLPSCQAAKLPS